MTKEKRCPKNLLPHLFRQEYTKMTAVLCRHFGLNHIEIAEDIVSDTFLKATENWAIEGIPQNPTAWLYTVAKNKTKDYFKHQTIFETKVKTVIQSDEILTENTLDFESKYIADSQLAMIFAVCNPANSTESQICLALQILCGFSVEEIANAFLSNKETIKKRLLRARNKLKNDTFQINSLKKTEIKPRIDTVLKTLYLLFNEGYFSKTNKNQIRVELCSEATRLVLCLVDNPLTNCSKANALLALMCFQSSRLPARTNEKGEAVLFEEQDTKLWDKALIQKGNYYLINACNENNVSKYHLEAGIAYWHTNSQAPDKWQQILRLYNQLVLIEYSPITALNRTFAFAKVYGHKKAISEAEKLNLSNNNFYHELLGYLYEDSDIHKSKWHYQQGMKLAKSKVEKQTLARVLDKISNR